MAYKTPEYRQLGHRKTVDIGRHLDGRVPQAVLRHLERQSQATAAPAA
jgi:hypothetical protein